MSELSELYEYTIAEARDWLELQRGYLGEVPLQFYADAILEEAK